MVHLFSRGFVIPVVTYIKNCLDKQDTDISLIRHFVTEVFKLKICILIIYLFLKLKGETFCILGFIQFSEKLEYCTSILLIIYMQVLDIIAPPYTPEFGQLFLPLIECKDITDSIRSDDGSDPVSEFICKCFIHLYLYQKCKWHYISFTCTYVYT